MALLHRVVGALACVERCSERRGECGLGLVGCAEVFFDLEDVEVRFACRERVLSGLDGGERLGKLRDGSVGLARLSARSPPV